MYFFSPKSTAQIMHPISTHGDSKDVVCAKEVPFQQALFEIFSFCESFSTNPHVLAFSTELPSAKSNKLNNFKRFAIDEKV